MTAKRKPLLLFDWDLTLADTERQKLHVFFSTVRTHGVTAFHILSHLQDIFHMNVIDFANILKEKQSIRTTLDEYHENCKKYSYLVRFKGEHLLHELKKKGYKVGIITNDYAPNVQYVLKQHHITMEYIADTTKTKEKPSPDSIIKALKHFKTKSQDAYYIGDNTTDVQAGKRAGVHTIALTTWYHSRNTLNQERPEHVIDDINDVLRIVQKH